MLALYLSERKRVCLLLAILCFLSVEYGSQIRALRVIDSGPFYSVNWTVEKQRGSQFEASD
jgi:hypothetical protein